MLGSNLAFALRCIFRARSKQPDLCVSGDSEHTHAVPGLEVRDRGGRQAWPLDHARAVCNNVCVCVCVCVERSNQLTMSAQPRRDSW